MLMGSLFPQKKHIRFLVTKYKLFVSLPQLLCFYTIFKVQFSRCKSELDQTVQKAH